jgi:hypothetical protein
MRRSSSRTSGEETAAEERSPQPERAGGKPKPLRRGSPAGLLLGKFLTVLGRVPPWVLALQATIVVSTGAGRNSAGETAFGGDSCTR